MSPAFRDLKDLCGRQTSKQTTETHHCMHNDKYRCCGNVRPRLRSLGWLLVRGDASVDPEN